jgi:hypothetical protein
MSIQLRRAVGAALALLLASSVSPPAGAQSQTGQVLTQDVSGATTQRVVVDYARLPSGCEYRLQLSAGSTSWGIREVAGDRGPPRRITTSTCTDPSFAATSGRELEEQTAYYWSFVSRSYALSNLWIKPPGWPLGPIAISKTGVQPNVIGGGNFGTACFPIAANADGCMRVWPHEGPKLHLESGRLAPELVVHEYGHYAAGFAFGHMDAFGFSLPAASGDCMKLAFQEAIADMFMFLVMHDQRHAAYAGADGFGPVRTNHDAKGPIACGDAYATALPVQQAFQQALWGTDFSRKVMVNWRVNPLDTTKPNDPKLANRKMANALTYALALNRGHRIDQLASSLVEWFDVNEPRRADAIRKIFAAHGYFVQPYGAACTAHPQCASFRCDNRPGAGCVAQDGMCPAGGFCTTHQQCRSGTCKVAAGSLRGVCAN